MEPLLELRVSRVGPAVENNLVQLVDMVKQMGRKNGNLTESQNRKMVGYMGNLDEMRGQLVIMIQRYEDDSHVLKRLLELVDRIDDVKNLALTAEASKDQDAPLITDEEIAAQYDTPFNPLMVSTLNILDVSGLFASKILGLPVEEEEQEEAEEEEEEGDAFWDHEDDPALIAEESAPHEVSEINLSVSNLHLPSLFDSNANITPASTAPISPLVVPLRPSLSTSSLSPMGRVKNDTVRNNLSLSDSNLPTLFDSRANHPTIPQPPPMPPKQDTKGKGKARRQLGVDHTQNGRNKGKGKGKDKGKGKAKVTFQGVSSSSELSGSASASESESGSEEEGASNGAQHRKAPKIGWRRTYPIPPPRFGQGSASSSSTAANRRNSGSETDSSSGSGSESEESSSSSTDSLTKEIDRLLNINAPPKKTRRKQGPCDPPVLCKICYDEYDKWDLVHQFGGCEHSYCRDCLRDYLATNINEGAVLDLTCPFPECKTEFPPSDIKFLCTSEIYAKYERFTLLAALRADPNARWCPNPYCNNGIKHNPATMPWVYCGACKFEFCFHCMAERHDGVACGKEALEYLKKKHESELEASNQFSEWTELMKNFVKPCPGCKAFIEKNDGCNHMTCTNPSCRAQFCWLCLNLYTGDHFVDDINFPDCYDKQYWTPPEILERTATIARQAAVIPRSRRFANVAKKVGIYMGVGVAVVTLGVPAAVIGGPVYGCFKLHKRLKARRRERADANRRDIAANLRRENWVPPSPQRIAEARREAQRLYELEHS